MYFIIFLVIVLIANHVIIEQFLPYTFAYLLSYGFLENLDHLAHGRGALCASVDKLGFVCELAFSSGEGGPSLMVDEESTI